jgi:hypothetical protein
VFIVSCVQCQVCSVSVVSSVSCVQVGRDGSELPVVSSVSFVLYPGIWRKERV